VIVTLVAGMVTELSADIVIVTLVAGMVTELSADIVTEMLVGGMVTEHNSATGCPQHFSRRRSSIAPPRHPNTNKS